MAPKRKISAPAREAMLTVMNGRATLCDAILAALWLEGFKLTRLSKVDLAAIGKDHGRRNR